MIQDTTISEQTFRSRRKRFQDACDMQAIKNADRLRKIEVAKETVHDTVQDIDVLLDRMGLKRDVLKEVV